jgi:quercetin 2,3-dioxygenase
MKTTFLATSTGGAVIVKRAADARGLSDFGWLHSRHSFSFGEYFDPDQMGFRSLRVINDDIVAPGQGFGTHGHRDAEIFSYVIEGELEHKDSMGNGSVIAAGNLQYMSAGSGVRHSEFNPSKTNPAHFLQVWLMPNVSGGAPRYAEKRLGEAATPNGLTLLLSGSGRDGSVAIRQDAEVSFGRLDAGKTVAAGLEPERYAWIHVIKGRVEMQDAWKCWGKPWGLVMGRQSRMRVNCRSAPKRMLNSSSSISRKRRDASAKFGCSSPCSQTCNLRPVCPVLSGEARKGPVRTDPLRP